MPRAAPVIVALAVAAGGWLVWRQGRTPPLTVSGIIEADDVRVGSRIGGRIAEVLVREGQRVAAGDRLLTIDPFDLRERLAEAEAQRASAQAEHERLSAGYRREEIEQARAAKDRAAAILERLKTGPRPQEIAIAQESFNQRQAELEFAESEHERLKRLQEAAQAAPTEYERAVQTLKVARARMLAAREQLGLLREGSRKEEIAEAQAELARAEQALGLLEQGYRKEDIAQALARLQAAEAGVRAIQAQLVELEVRAPCECIVETIDLRPGDLVAPNAPTVALLDARRLWVRCYVPEAHLGRVRLGSKMPIRVDGFPERTFTGEVTYIAQEGEFTPRNIQTPEERSKQVFRVKVTFTEGLDRLRAGMWADVPLDQPIEK